MNETNPMANLYVTGTGTNQIAVSSVPVPVEKQKSVAESTVSRLVQETGTFNTSKLAELARKVTKTNRRYSKEESMSTVYNYVKANKFGATEVDMLLEIHPDYSLFGKYFAKKKPVVNATGEIDNNLYACGCAMMGADGDDTTKPIQQAKIGTMLAIAGVTVVLFGIVASLLND